MTISSQNIASAFLSSLINFNYGNFNKICYKTVFALEILKHFCCSVCYYLQLIPSFHCQNGITLTTSKETRCLCQYAQHTVS